MPATPVPPVVMPPVVMPPVVVVVPPGAVPPPPVPPGGLPGAVATPALPVTAEHKTSNDACINRLKKLEIPEGARFYPKPTPPSVAGTECKVQTNVFGIEVHKDSTIHQYVVNISADLTSKKEVIFTKKAKEDFIVNDRHEKCCAIVVNGFTKYEDFFKTNENCLVYDGQSLLFSTIDLFPGFTDAMVKSRLLEINGAETECKDLHTLPVIKLEIFASKSHPIKMTQEDLGKRSSDSNIGAINRGYHNLLELAANQYCIRQTQKCVVFEHGKIFFINPLDDGFDPSDVIDVGDGKAMFPGLKKTIQFIEGPHGRGQNNPSIVIDGMKVAFHKEQNVLDKLADIVRDPHLGLKQFDRERCVQVIKRLDCYSNYTGRLRHLKIEGIHHDNARNARFELPIGGSSSVLDYFKNKYNITLKYPNANLLVCKSRGQINFYPMELMYITRSQRVTIPQQTGAQSQRTTKESAVLPNIRQRIIMTGKHAARINSDNETLKALGVTICDNPLLVNGRQLPGIHLGTRESDDKVLPERDFKYRIGEYTRPAEAPDVWAMYAVGGPQTRFDETQLRKFGAEFVAMCAGKGIRLPPVTDTGLLGVSQIEDRLIGAATNKCKFVFIMTDDTITSLHQKYKKIERDYGMIIQDMKISKASSVLSGKRLTLENVILKTNVKLGGTNYLVRDYNKLFDDHLIIGVGFSNSPVGASRDEEGKPQLNPKIVGYAFNGKKQQEFIGDFFLSANGQDTIACIEDIVTTSLETYKEANGKLPRRITVYRSGVSEGQHGPVIAFEVPLAVAALKRFSTDIKLIYIAVSKDHTYRFFRNDLRSLTGGGSSGGSSSSSSRPSIVSTKATDLNVQPGLLIDTEVTNPACKQFFLNAHVTLQGSAKTPLYTVLSDESNVPLSRLEELTYQLCYNHQIIGLATSVPTALYVANEYAKRGRNLFIEANAAEKIALPKGTDEDKMKHFTNIINYKTSNSLFGLRVNA